MEESKQENGQVSSISEQAAQDEENLNKAIATLTENLRESILKMIDSTVKKKVEERITKKIILFQN